MKTLAQVEPRTPISNLPFTITNSGSYYLTASLNGQSGQNGISVQADNVTLDLNGFALLGISGSLHGISVNPGQQNFVVHNGILRGWGGNGLEAAAAVNCRVERVLPSNNTGHGLAVGPSSTVNDCLVLANGGDGIRVASVCLVLNNGCSSNGIAAGNAGIHAIGNGNRIEGNNLTANTGVGIKVDGAANLVIKNSAAYSTVTDYDIAPGSSYGQLVQAPGAGFTNATAWANFSSACPPGQSFCAGVCVSLTNNVNNCGACGNVCSFANATANCVNGNCVIASCNAGFADCNNQAADGCEINLNNNVNDCGACNNICSLPNATAGCSAGQCVIASCNAGYADCDANRLNGCEVNVVTDVNNCGACGKVCSNNNIARICTTGVCNGVCNAGFADCNGNKQTDGCEVNIATDVNNCGGCAVACSNNNITRSCTGGICNGTCNTGFADCNGNKQTDGCEVNIVIDVSNCGGCGITCSNNHVTRSCIGGICNGICYAGFADCNGNKQTDGCEVDIAIDVNNCGGCGVFCSNNNITRMCTAGVCNGVCNAGFADCNGNKQIDGCEVNLVTDNNNCGNCGNVCNVSTQQCASGACKLKSGQPCTLNSQCASNVCLPNNLCQ